MIGILNSNVNTGLDSEIKVELVAPVHIISNQPAFMSETLSLKQDISTMKTQRWELTANIKPTNDSSDFLIHSVSSGKNKLVYIRMPQVFRMNQDTPVYTPVILSADALQYASILNVSGNVKKVRAGEFINVGGATKVYLVTDVSPNDDFLTISPPLKADAAAGSEIAYGDRTTLVTRYSMESVLGIKYTDGVLADNGANTFIEAI